MEMYQFETIHHFTTLHEVYGFKQFRTVKSEFRLVAAAFLPFSGTGT